MAAIGKIKEKYK